MKKILLSTAFLLTMHSPLASQLPAGVSFHSLDNGLEVLLIEKTSLPMIGVNVVVQVGSAYEDFATSGMSHMLEHLLFNGTESMTQKELYDAVDRIGGYNNANTGQFFTNFMMVTPVATFEQGMRIQSDMLFRSILPPEKFEKEKGIVMEEIGKSLGRPAEQEERNIKTVLYPGHALSLPTLGTYATIQGMERDDVYHFYKSHYVPNNMRMSVVGNFDSSEMLEMIRKIYGQAGPGKVESSDTPLWKTGFSNLSRKPAESVHHRVYSGKELKLNLLYALSGELNDDSLTLLEIQLRNKEDELDSLLQEKYPDQISALTLGVRSTPAINHLEADITLKNDRDIAAVSGSVSEWLNATDFSLSESQLSVEVIKARTDFLKNTEKPHMFGIFNAAVIAETGFQQVIDSFSGGGLENAAPSLGRLDLQDAPTAILQHPEADAKEGEAAKASNIRMGQGRNDSPVLIVKETPDSGILAIHYLIGHKYGLERKHGKNAAKLWHEALGERLKEAVEQGDNYRFGFTFTVNDNPYIPMDNIYLHDDFGYIRVEGLAEDVSAAITFLNREFLSFKPTESAFNKALKESSRSAMMGVGNESESAFNDSWKGSVYEDNDEQSEPPELTYDRFLEFGRYYSQPANMVISVVSPAPFDDVAQNFSDFTSDVTVPDSIASWRQDLVLNSEPIEVTKELNGEQTYLFYGFVKKTRQDEEAALAALNLLLKDHIVFDIREKRGMAYRMDAGITVKKESALFYVRLGTLPKNAAELAGAFPSFFTTDFTEMITEDSLERAVNMYLGRMMFRRLSSINQGYYLGTSYYFDQDYLADSRRIDALSKVTVEEVRHVADKYLRVENPIRITVK